MKKLLLAALFTLLAPQFASAQLYRCVDENGNFGFSDRPCEKVENTEPVSDAGTEANLLITLSHGDIEQWVLASPGERAGKGRLSEVKRNQLLYLPIVVTFDEPQDIERLGLVADIQITRPNGTVLDLPNCCMTRGMDPRSPTTVVLQPVVEYTLNSSDRNGEYRVRVVMNDGKTTFIAEETFQLIN